MIRELTHAAWRLDDWLQRRLGRPYNALLGIGLVTEIVRQASELPGRISSAHGVGAVVFPLMLESALLVHQLGALSHHAQNRLGKSP